MAVVITNGPKGQRTGLARRRLVVLSILALTGAACGTRVDRSAYLRSVEGQTAQASAGGQGTQGGAGATDAAATATGNGGANGRVGSRPATAPAGGTAAPGGASGSGASNPYGLSTTTVGSTVVVGLHLPETGAAPLPMGWQQDVNTVQAWLGANPVNGRKVQFDVQDDGYDPSTGSAACNKILGANPLAVVGWSMPEVEVGCGQLFAGHHIAYIARGASPNIVTGCSVPICYFATMADDVQGKLAGDYVVDQMGGAHAKVGMVFENDQPASPTAFVAEMKAKGGSVVVQDSSVPRQSDFSSTIVKLQQAGCQIVLLSMAPVDAITISTQAQSQGYHPTWLGLGTYFNYNMTLQSAGMAMDGAITFSPWASIDSSAASQWKSVDAQFSPGSQPDDVGLVIFGLGSLLRAALVAAGPNLSEASLVGALNGLQYSAPFWAPVGFSPQNHMGPVTVAVFKADGQAKRWNQITGFSSGF